MLPGVVLWNILYHIQNRGPQRPVTRVDRTSLCSIYHRPTPELQDTAISYHIALHCILLLFVILHDFVV